MTSRVFEVARPGAQDRFPALPPLPTATVRQSQRPHRCCAVLLAVAGWAAAGEHSPLTGTVVFATGYEEDALLLPETLAIGSGISGASADARAQVGWQALRGPGGRLDMTANGGHRQVDGSALEEQRAGGGISGTGALGSVALNASVDGDRRWLDGAGLAWNAGLILGAALPMERQVARPQVEVRAWGYDERSAADAVMVTARYRHWLPIADGDPRRRAELGVEATRHQADSDEETYGEARIDAGLRGRIGPNRGSGRWDFAAGSWIGLRDYRDGSRERRQLAGFSGSLDRWFDTAVAFGLEAGWNHGSDQPDGDTYDNLRAALRATAAF